MPAIHSGVAVIETKCTGDQALGNLGPQDLGPKLSLFCRNASTDNGSNILCTQLAQETTEWVAEDCRFWLLW